MKNKKSFVIMSALAACSLILVGCNKTAEESVSSEPVSSSQTTADSVSITVAANIPAYIEKGQVIDLDQYVTISPANAEVTLVPQDDADTGAKAANVSVSGHKVTGVSLGAFLVTINVKSGIASDVSAFEGRVVSSDFAKIVAFIASFKGNSMTSYEGKSASWVIEIMRSIDYFGYSDTTQWQGYLKAKKDSNYYKYKLAGDTAGAPSTTATDLVVYPGIRKDAANQYGFWRPELGADGLVEKVKDDGSSDGIFLDVSTDAKKSNSSAFLNQFGFYNFDDIKSEYNLTIASVAIVATKDADGNVTRIDLNCYDAAGAKIWVAAAFDVGSTKIQVVEDYANGDVVPDPVDATKLKNGIKAITTAKSYTADCQAVWLTTAGALDAQYAAYDYYPSYELDANQYFGTMYAADTTTAEKSSTATDHWAHQKIDGVYNLLQVDTQTVSSVTTLLDTYTSTVESSLTDLWATTLALPNLLTDALLDENTLSYTSQSTDASTGAITWEFDASDAAGLKLMTNVLSTVAGGVGAYYAKSYTSKGYLGDFNNFLTLSPDGTISVGGYLVFKDGIQWFETDVSKIGSTTATVVASDKIHSSVASSAASSSAAHTIRDHAGFAA